MTKSYLAAENLFKEEIGMSVESEVTPASKEKTYSYDEVMAASKKYFGDELPAQVFVNKYAIRDNDNNYYELTPDDLHDRLSDGFARIDYEKYGLDYKSRRVVYRDSLNQFSRIVAQGSPMAAIGNNKQLMSASNCMVIASPEDSIAGIMKSATELAQLLKRRAGVGMDLSTLRPEGLAVNNAARNTSGAWSFADFFSYITRMIAQNGRRGALMITMGVHHPDIVKFAQMKNDKTKVTGANISVRLSDEFLKAVETDSMYEQRWPEESPTFKRMVRAKEVWNVIIKNATENAEPGIIFWDRMTDYLPANSYPRYKSISTNPSLRGDTLIATDTGVKSIKWLSENRSTTTVRNIDGKWHKCKVFKSGENKKLVKILFSNNQSIYCTPEHKWPLLNSTNKVRSMTGKIIKKPSIDLKVNDKVYFPSFDKPINNLNCKFSRKDGFVLGCESGIASDVLSYTNSLAKIPSTLRSDHGASALTYVTTDKNVHNKFVELKANKKSEGIPESVWEGNHEFIVGFIDGIFSSDGHVRFERNISKCYLNLTSSHRLLVDDIRKLLSFYGIKSYIQTSKSSKVRFPNPKYNSTKEYTRHDLRVTGEHAIKFARIFGLSNFKKKLALKRILEEAIPKLSSNGGKTFVKPRNYLSVKSVELTDISEDVYDITVDDDTHTFLTEAGITGNCSEIPLSSFDACRLMSINLTGYVRKAFTEAAHFDWITFEQDIKTATQMCDNLVDLELELVDKIKAVCSDKEEKDLWEKIWNSGFNGRRVGLGLHGHGDMLAQLTIKYDSEEAIKFIGKIEASLRDVAYGTSIELAKTRGAFPAFDWELEKDNAYIRTLPKDIQSDLKKYGRRNIALLTHAPTGSISILSKCGEFNRFNTSSGIEPVFRNSYTRRKKINPNDPKSRCDFRDELGDCWQEFPVFHTNVTNYLEKMKGIDFANLEANLDLQKRLRDETLPDYFVTSDQIDWNFRVKLQGKAQYYLDHSISSTLNCPKGTSPEAVGKIYLEAWKQGLKGVTVYVDGSRSGVLITNKEKDGRPTKIIRTQAPKRPSTLQCDIHHVTYEGKKWTVVVGLLADEPYEIFMGYSKDIELPEKSKFGKISRSGRGTYSIYLGEDDTPVVKDVINSFDNQQFAWTTRLISMSLRHGTPMDFVVEQLGKDGKLNDLNRVIARVLKKYIKDGELVKSKTKCPTCNSNNFIYEGGCPTCRDCGYSKCT